MNGQSQGEGAQPAIARRAGSRPFAACRRGTTAVEFAMIAPVFLFLIHGIICLGTINSVYSGIQQISAEAARATVSGLTASEREALARQYVADHAGSFAFIDPQKIDLRVSAVERVFAVTVHYDMSDLFVYRMGSWMALPASGIERTSVVHNGGY